MSDYMPGAVQIPQPGGVTLDTSLPPRFVWHITWDALQPDGTQPEFSAVADYLKGKEWCPHIMWNPFTGDLEQYYPASVGARALTYNDQDGSACVQVEIFFTPGCVVDGIKYATVADTPLVGWAELLAWADSLGVPRTWPMGAPQWQGNPRDVGIWNGNAGHYGHCNSPGDTHTDPGPMPSLTGTITPQSATITQEDDLTPEQENQLAYIASPAFKKDMYQAVWFGHDGGDLIQNRRTGQGAWPETFLGSLEARVQNEILPPALSNLPANVLNHEFTLLDGTVTNLSGILDAIHAKPVTAGTAATVTTDPQAIAAAFVDHVNISITQK
jgi:hypothetical protein